MPGGTKAPGEYSTNPNTVKARRRRMNLTGAEKVEEAARCADYKAMLHARKAVQAKPQFADASDSEKSAMLEEAMRQTMEKRRQRGQDTMSKLAAYRAGNYRDGDGANGPRTRVPISAFLRDNGFVPSPTVRAPQGGAGPSHGEQSFSPNGRLGSAPAHHTRRNVNLLESQSPSSPPFYGIKASPGPFANMDPEPMLSSIEGDVPMTDVNELLAKIQIEMGHMRTICQNHAASNKNIRELELGNIEAEMNMEKGRVRDLEVRVSQMEGVMHALQNTSLINIVDRVEELESIVQQLQAKVGSGCDAEVAKMREVMGGLKSSLDNVGGF